jgi:electron transfer flavoprotein alpha subunit
VANVLVWVELVGDRPHPASLEVLGQARRVGSALGGTVHALAACRAQPGFGDDDLVAILSRHGADKVLLAVDARHGGAPRWGSHGPALLSACGRVQPTLMMLAETRASRDLAARLAARLGAAYLGDAWVEVAGDRLGLFEGSGPTARRLDGDLDFAVVAAIPPGRYRSATGDEEAEVEVLETPPAAPHDFEPLDEAASLPAAVVVGDGEPAARLAAALGGVVASDVGASGCAPLAVSLQGAFADARADTRVALGPQAAACEAAHYALADEDAAAALVHALGAARRTGGAAPALSTGGHMPAAAAVEGPEP